MGGFLGIGGSSSKTDRGNQLQAVTDSKNIFNWAMPAAQSQQASGTNTIAGAQDTLKSALTPLSEAESYWSKLLTAGRAETAQNSAPAINATLDSADTAKRQEASQGTARTGGTVEANHEAGAQTRSKIDDIINQNMVGGRQAGAEGLTKAAGTTAEIGAGLGALGSTIWSNAANLLGTSTGIQSQIMDNATDSRKISMQAQQDAGAAVGNLIMAGLSLFGG
jgi:hypothetical protein